MPKYSMPFIVRIHRFLEVCMAINELENSTKKDVDQLVNSDFFNVEIVRRIKDSYQNEFSKLKQTSDVLLRYIYRKSKKENFYFFDCPFEVYINHFDPRKIKFLEGHIDAEESHFIQQEIDHLEQPAKHKTIKIKYRFINKYLLDNGGESIDFSRFKDPDYSYNSVIYFNEKSVTINYSKLISSNTTWQYSYQKKLDFLNIRLQEIKEEKKAAPVKRENPGRSKQLTINQAVILLDDLGMFTSNILESSSKKKQADIISLLIGKNAKNVKIAIEKLEKSPSENGKRYQADIIKIKNMLDDQS